MEIAEELRSILWNRYGPRFRGIVLYGSYARGDYDSGSDIDLLVLMEDGTELDREREAISKLTHRLDYKCHEYGTILSPYFLLEGDYQRGKSPFFLNVKREGISLSPGDRINMRQDVDDLLRRANRDLEGVRVLLSQDFYDIAASRAYYAMFYAAEAVLLSRGMARSRHTGVIHAFNEYFVNTGLLPQALYSDLNSAFNQRQQADYGPEKISRESAESLLRDAEEFVGAVERFLDTE